MRIRLNKEIGSFLKRCEKNLMDESKNDFLFMEVTKENESKIQKQLKWAGFAEFFVEESEWPSLFLSTEEFLQSPYYKNIKFDEITDENVTFKKHTIESNRLFNVDEIRQDPNKELNDWMVLRALDKSYDANVLMIDEELWMIDIYSEALTINPKALKAHGNVLTFGLGLGYFVYMALLNPKVEHVSVVESNKVVIDIFEKYLLPQFDKQNKITIIHDDAFEYYNSSNVSNFDYVFVDIYQSNEDGLDVMERMLMNHLPDSDKVDFWIENSIIEVMSGIIFYYFNRIAHKKTIIHHDEYFNHLLYKTHQYFDQQQFIIDDVSELKRQMYDRDVIRKILSIS